MPLPATVKNKKQGDIIRSDDWNIVTNEVDRLDTAKANLSGAAFTGPLSVQAPTGQPQLSLAGSSGNVTTEPGDLRIGGSFHQLRIGVSISGASAGDVRLRSVALSQGQAKVSSRLMLGTGNTDMCTFDSDGITTFHDSAGNTALAIVGADLILPGRTNPTWHIKNANGTRGNGKMCRAIVNWKEGALDQLYINWGNDFAGGTFIASSLTIPSHNLNFGAAVRQMINLWDNGAGNNANYGIGVQGNTQYYRTGAHFAWFRGGVHHDNQFEPGAGGVKLMHLTNAGHLVIAGQLFINNSDENLKKNISGLEGALDKLTRLRGVTFEWKDMVRIGSRPGSQIGFIAQEVEKEFPDWVTTGLDGNKSIGFIGFEALVVEALRELKNEIEAIKEKIGLTTAPQAAARSTKKS